MDSSLLLDRYIIQESLGSGSGGTVNLAWDTRIQRNVAIKRIALPEHSGQLTVPGLEEARTGAQLHDSRIVNVYDFEVTEHEALLIMEYVDGMSLGSLMDRIPRKLSLSEIASVVQNLGKALQHAHQHHVLHLDVKPDNVLIDTSGQSKVTDFGIGKLAMGSMYGSAIGGTIGYMPPEQILGEEVTAKTDQWAFAVLVYELLTGENPFIAPTFEQSLDKIWHSELVMVSSLEEQVDPELDDVLFQAMSIDPADRYPSVAKFVSALMPYLGDPKKGRAYMGMLVENLGSTVVTGSPEDRIAMMRKLAFEQPVPADAEEEAEPEADAARDDDYADEGGGKHRRRRNRDGRDDDEDDAYGQERQPRELPVLRDCVSDRMASVVTHIIGCVCCAMLAYMGVGGIGEATLANGFELTGATAIVVVAVVAVVGAIWPRLASIAALAILGAGAICAGYVTHGTVTICASLIWWAFAGRYDDAVANCGMLAPCLGPVMLAFAQPLLCGYFLDFKKAALTSVLGVALMLSLFPITGGTEIYSTSLAFSAHTTASDLAATNYYQQAWVWIEAVGWVVATLLMWLMSRRGSKALSLAGAVVSVAIMIVSRALGGAASEVLRGMLSAETIAAYVLPFLVVALVIWLHDPKKAS